MQLQADSAIQPLNRRFIYMTEEVGNQAPKTNLVPVELSNTRPGISCLAIS